MIKKLVIIGLFVVVGVLFVSLDLSQYLTLDYLKTSQDRLSRVIAASPAMSLAVYMLVYILVTGFSLPGAAVMSLGGAALFGFWPSLFAVSFASSIGAALACFFARYVLRDWVQKRFSAKLEPIDRGVAKEGGFYLFSLRLVPLFPFVLINLAIGLSSMRLWTFYWISQLGMLPGTIVYVNAGTELGKINSPGDILSPGLVVSFVILGLFPLAAKKALLWYKSRKAKKSQKI